MDDILMTFCMYSKKQKSYTTLSQIIAGYNLGYTTSWISKAKLGSWMETKGEEGELFLHKNRTNGFGN